MAFVAFETGLKFGDFQSDSGVIPDLRPSWLVINWFSLGPGSNFSKIPESDSRGLETESEKRTRIHVTLETGLHMILRSLVAPTRGAGGLSETKWLIREFQKLRN